MEIEECIRGRRSVRHYSDEPVSKDHIEAVLEAGVWAPTGMNRQPWKFIVVEDKDVIKLVSDEAKKLVSEVMPNMAEMMDSEDDVICYRAPVLILICAESDERWSQVNLLDSVLAAQNMFLKAHELGLGTCYMGFVALLKQKPGILGTIGVPDGLELMVPLILGHPKGEQPPGERNKPDVTAWIK
ncbi:MAG: nitroreductase family protein [Candidatus Altiarchaeales archaeon]|nr:nitroreductase family protein [Candidatus Altiarchaeales archaeon]MBD3416894.1 nitroreductase family protein [Candidatus Altiarchaeales archaeon]